MSREKQLTEIKTVKIKLTIKDKNIIERPSTFRYRSFRTITISNKSINKSLNLWSYLLQENQYNIPRIRIQITRNTHDLYRHIKLSLTRLSYPYHLNTDCLLYTPLGFVSGWHFPLCRGRVGVWEKVRQRQSARENVGKNGKPVVRTWCELGGRGATDAPRVITPRDSENGKQWKCDKWLIRYRFDNNDLDNRVQKITGRVNTRSCYDSTYFMLFLR